MEVRKVNDCLILPRTFPLKQRALHELAKNAWNNLLIRDDECVFILRETEKLIAHRQKVLDNLPETLSGDLPKRLKSKLINAVYCLQEGYREAVIWEQKCKSALPFTIFKPTIAGEYQVTNFIDSSGHFNELEWAKRFVDDEKQFILDRFILACFYCFEKKIKYLWRTMKDNNQLPCEGRLTDIKSQYKDDDLIVIWAYQLENNFDELRHGNRLYANGFYLSGLYDAIIDGHEYAARFFWNRLSENEKNYFLRNPEFALLADAAEGNHAGLVSFIYSLLNNEQKKELVSCIIEDYSLSSILYCLLRSQYYESVLDDILNPTSQIPTKIYKWILISLSFEIAELQNPLYKKIFKELWDYLPQDKRKEVLEGDSYIIMNFVKITDMDLLKMIIQPLSHYEKDKMLLDDWQKAGISAIDDFSYRGDYDNLSCYLHFFFIDCCPDTQQFNLRSDASSLFDKFINSESFIDFTIGISDSEEKALSNFIEKFKDSLNPSAS